MWPKSTLYTAPSQHPARSFPKPEPSLLERVWTGGTCLPC